MPQSESEKAIKEISDWFKKRTNSAEKVAFGFSVWQETIPDSGFVAAKDVALVWSKVYQHLADLYRALDNVTIQFLKFAVKNSQESSKVDKELEKLKDELKKQKPIVTRLEQAFEWTDRILEENR